MSGPEILGVGGPHDAPFLLEPGATYRTRDGYDVLLIEHVEIPYNLTDFWWGWVGMYLDDGSHETWNKDGRWSATRAFWDSLDIHNTGTQDLVERLDAH